MSNALNAFLAVALYTTRPHSVFPLLIHSFACLLVFPFHFYCVVYNFSFFVFIFFFTRCENSCGACSTICLNQFSVHFARWCWHVCLFVCVSVSHSHMINCIHIEYHANTYKHTDDFIHCYHRWMWKPNPRAKQTKQASNWSKKSTHWRPVKGVCLSQCLLNFDTC